VVAITIEFLEPGMCSKVQRQIRNIVQMWSWDSSVHIKISCVGQSRNWGLNIWQGEEIFLVFTASIPILELTQPLVQ
jgi:hypothetical protein